MLVNDNVGSAKGMAGKQKAILQRKPFSSAHSVMLPSAKNGAFCASIHCETVKDFRTSIHFEFIQYFLAFLLYFTS